MWIDIDDNNVPHNLRLGMKKLENKDRLGMRMIHLQKKNAQNAHWHWGSHIDLLFVPNRTQENPPSLLLSSKASYPRRVASPWKTGIMLY